MATIRKLENGKWQVSIRKSNHKAIYKTFIEKTVARKWAREVESQIEKDTYTDYGNAETITVKDLIIKYRDEIVPEHKAKKSTTHKLNKLMRYPVATQFLLRLRSSHLYQMQKSMKREGLAPKTTNIYVQLLVQIWNTAKSKWSINLPAQEYKLLLEKAEQSNLHILRDFIEFLYCTGARYSEALNLKRENTDLVKGLATFLDTKNGEDRTIPLADNVIEILKRYPFGETFFKFRSYDSYKFYFKQACRKADIDNFRSHDLRACFITNCLLGGMQESEVAKISGHKDFRSLSRYVRMKPKDLKEKVNNVVNLKKSIG
jgi:integrase